MNVNVRGQGKVEIDDIGNMVEVNSTSYTGLLVAGLLSLALKWEALLNSESMSNFALLLGFVDRSVLLCGSHHIMSIAGQNDTEESIVELVDDMTAIVRRHFRVQDARFHTESSQN